MATIADVVKKAKTKLVESNAEIQAGAGERNKKELSNSSQAELAKGTVEQSIAGKGIGLSNVEKPCIETGESSIPSSISYTKTKVVKVSNDVLVSNRVIAQNKEDPRSTPFHMLRAKVLSEMRKNNWSTVAVTAPTPGAGKSLVAVNLAMSIAMEVNQTVLVVDMDLRQPSVHKYFSIEPEYGFQDYVENDIEIDKILINPGVERLSILPGRKRILNSSERLSSPKTRQLTEELKNRYDSRIIIYDLPPLLVSDDVLVFLPYVDCSLLVVESGKNTEPEIQESLEMTNIKPMLGIVLNKDVEQRNIYVY